MTSRLIFMTSCDCETYYLYCAICQQTSEHLRINNVSPFSPSIGLTALSASFSSFSSSSSKWQFTLSKLWGFPIGATGQWDLFSFSFFLHYLNVWWKCTKILFFIVWMCMLLWDTFSVRGPPHFFIHTCLCVNSSPVSPLLHFFDRFLLP